MTEFQRLAQRVQDALVDLAGYVGRIEADRDRYGEALEQIRDGIFSGNQAADLARQSLASSAKGGA